MNTNNEPEEFTDDDYQAAVASKLLEELMERKGVDSLRIEIRSKDYDLEVQRVFSGEVDASYRRS